MNPPPTLIPVIQEAGRLLSDRAWEHVKDSLLRSFLLSLNQAAGHVGLSPENTRRLAQKHGVLIDMGSRNKRISIAGLEALVAAQTLKQTKRTKGTK